MLASTQSRRKTPQAHNSAQLISRLPNEIFTHVFQLHRKAHVYDILGEREDSPSDDIPHDQLLPFLYVCSEWRTIALCCPLLWRRIDFGMHSRRMCEMMLGAAGEDCLLDVVVRPRRIYRDDWDADQEEVLEMIRPVMGRLRSVFLGLHYASFIQFLPELYCFHASLPSEVAGGPLCEICIRAYPKKEDDEEQYWLPRLDWSRLPSLRVLVMNDVTIDWLNASSSFRNSSITHISFDTDEPSEIIRNQTDLISFIALFPSLVAFRYYPGIPAPTALDRSNFDSCKPVVMRYLCEIDLHGGLIPIALSSFLAFFRRLSLPRKDITWTVRLEYDNDSPDQQDMATMLSELAHLMFSTTSISDMYVRAQEDHAIAICGGGATVHPRPHSFTITFKEGHDDDSDWSEFDWEFTAEPAQATLIRAHLIRAFGSNFPGIRFFTYKDVRQDTDCTHVEAKRTSTKARRASREQVESWRAFLEKQRALEALSVQGSGLIRHVINAYSPDKGKNPSSSSPPDDNLPQPYPPTPPPPLLLTPSLRSLEAEFTPDASTQLGQKLVSLYDRLRSHDENFYLRVTYLSSSDDLEWEKEFLKEMKKPGRDAKMVSVIEWGRRVVFGRDRARRGGEGVEVEEGGEEMWESKLLCC